MKGKGSELSKLDKDSEEFKKVREEYKTTRIVDFLAKYEIGSTTAQKLFGQKGQINKSHPKKQEIRTPKFPPEEQPNYRYYDMEGYIIVN